MMKKELLLVATASLVAASFPVFAKGGGGEGGASVHPEVVRAASDANVQAENAGVTQTVAPGSSKNGPAVVAYSPLKSSFYAGLGIDMLNDKGFTGLMPKIMVGYGFFYGKDKKYYTALEIGAGAGTILLSSNNQQYRVSSLVNASILPGYMIYDEVMLYGRLGAQATRYSNLNSTKCGGLYGIGLDVITSQNWDTRIEYNYANNKNLNQYSADFIYKFR